MTLDEGLKCNQLNEWHCFGLYPEEFVSFNNKDEFGDIITTLNCVECGCQPGVGPLVPLEECPTNAPEGWTPVNDVKSNKNKVFEEWRNKKRPFEN